MREEVISFLSRMNALAGVQVDICDATGLVRELRPEELANPEGAADLVLDACKRDASGKSGRVRFELIASKEGKRIGREPVIIDAGQGPLGAEDASQQGLLLEFMRNNRVLMQMVLSSAASNAERQDRRLEVMENNVLKTEEQRIKIFETLETLISHKDERAMQLRKQDQEQRNQARMVESMMPLVKQLGGKVVAHIGAKNGQAGASSHAPVSGSDVAQFINSLRPEQQETILKTLDPMQQAALAMMVESASAEEEAIEKAADHVVNGTPSSSPNSAGGVG